MCPVVNAQIQEMSIKSDVSIFIFESPVLRVCTIDSTVTGHT